MFILILMSGVALLGGYFFWRLHVAFGRALGAWQYAVAALLVLLAAGIFLGRAAARHGWEIFSDILVTMTVLGLVLLFWFFSVGLVLHLWNAGVWLIARAWPGAKVLSLAPRAGFLACAGLVVLACVWSWFGAAAVRVRHVTVEVAHLPAGMDRLRIAQVSDLHVGSPRSRARLAQTVAMLEQLKPDLIVSTGDLVDAHFDQIGPLAGRFDPLHPPLGKYAIFGNHEFYAGEDNSLRFLQDAGFEVLRQQAAEPVEGLKLVGVDDPVIRRFGSGQYVDELPVLPDGPRDETVILLKHRPRVDPTAAERFDLQLSGHTHGGQVFPFGLVVWGIYGYAPGLHELPAGSMLYLNRGTGTWGVPLRLASRPEITLIELKRHRNE